MFRVLAAACVIGVLVMSIATLRAGTAQDSLRVGDRLPLLKGQFLSGRDAELPLASSGTVALVAMGFTYKSRFPVEAWGEWYRATRGQRSDITFFIVIDKTAIVRWLHRGGFDQARADELHGILTSLADGSTTMAVHNRPDW